MKINPIYFNTLKLSDFDYNLPPKYIAQTPIEPRDATRLLVLDRKTGKIEHTIFREISQYFRGGDIVVLNETRVIPARLFANKIPTGGKIELLLLKRIDNVTWETLVGGKGMGMGVRMQIEGGPVAEVMAILEGAQRLVRFSEPIEPFLNKIGHTPLPPYIHTPLEDPERYQTIYAHNPGSAAAPTAGLHFTPQLIDQLKSLRVQFGFVTLHIGLDTFAPVTENDPSQHRIHTEWCQVSPDVASAINQARSACGRVIAVGTTTVRTLESAVDEKGVTPFEGPTNLFILPGYPFKIVDALVTNFHLPRSTLIMLVSAFAGREKILNAYEVAKIEGYRFYSFGDAMLIL